MEDENLQLTDQLETRRVMERAKSLLQRELNMDDETAYLMLQKQSRQKRKRLREIAEALIPMEDSIRGDYESTGGVTEDQNPRRSATPTRPRLDSRAIRHGERGDGARIALSPGLGPTKLKPPKFCIGNTTEEK